MYIYSDGEVVVSLGVNGRKVCDYYVFEKLMTGKYIANLTSI